MTSTTITEDRGVHGSSSEERERYVKVSWGALFAGTVTALATWILLYALGLAIGLSAIDPQDIGSARVAGIGTGVWSIIAPLIALFVGGYVAAHFAGRVRRTEGILHGVVVWALTTIGGLLVLGLVLSTIVGAVFGVGSQVVQSGAQAAQASGGGGGITGGLQAFGLDYDSMLVPVNQRLREQGLPPITADQLKSSMQDSLQAMVQTGRFDREPLVSSLATNTTMSRAEAEEVASTVETRFQAAGRGVQQGALTAADRTGKAFWGISLALLLGLISAILGAAVGAGSGGRSRRDRERDVVVTRPATAGT